MLFACIAESLATNVLKFRCADANRLKRIATRLKDHAVCRYVLLCVLCCSTLYYTLLISSASFMHLCARHHDDDDDVWMYKAFILFLVFLMMFWSCVKISRDFVRRTASTVVSTQKMLNSIVVSCTYEYECYQIQCTRRYRWMNIQHFQLYDLVSVQNSYRLRQIEENCAMYRCTQTYSVLLPTHLPATTVVALWIL